MAANYLKTLPLRRHGAHRRLGPQLRRVLHADRGDRSADALPRRRRRRRRRRLRDVLRGSVSRRLDGEPHRHAGAESRRSTRRRHRCRTSTGWRGRCSILHGTADVNVPYLHSVRLVDELLKKGKGQLVEFMTYPGEFHYFTRAHVLRDAWTRVDRFFATHSARECRDELKAEGKRRKAKQRTKPADGSRESGVGLAIPARPKTQDLTSRQKKKGPDLSPGPF